MLASSAPSWGGRLSWAWRSTIRPTRREAHPTAPTSTSPASRRGSTEVRGLGSPTCWHVRTGSARTRTQCREPHLGDSRPRVSVRALFVQYHLPALRQTRAAINALYVCRARDNRIGWGKGWTQGTGGTDGAIWYRNGEWTRAQREDESAISLRTNDERQTKQTTETKELGGHVPIGFCERYSCTFECTLHLLCTNTVVSTMVQYLMCCTAARYSRAERENNITVVLVFYCKRNRINIQLCTTVRSIQH